MFKFKTCKVCNHEAYLSYVEWLRNAAQRRSWTFYETVKGWFKNAIVTLAAAYSTYSNPLTKSPKLSQASKTRNLNYSWNWWHSIPLRLPFYRIRGIESLPHLPWRWVFQTQSGIFRIDIHKWACDYSSRYGNKWIVFSWRSTKSIILKYKCNVSHALVSEMGSINFLQWLG